MKKINFYTKPLFFATVFIAISFALSAQTTIYYGMTSLGGTSNKGTIVSFDPATNIEQMLWSFGSDSDGATPHGSFVYDPANGLFYATTYAGGSSDSGAIISFNPANNAELVVWSFAGTTADGSQPSGNLVYDASNGLFYAMTLYGGTNNKGTIVSFNPTNNAERLLWSFGGGTDGSEPLGNLVYCPANSLYYGMTFLGGSSDSGTIISFNPANNAELVAYSFLGTVTDGSHPNADLVYDSTNGLFYGMTERGGANNLGAVISFNPTTGRDSLLQYLLSGKASNTGSFVYDANEGVYLGTRRLGGTNSAGNILSYNPTVGQATNLFDFPTPLAGGISTNAAYPEGNLIASSDTAVFYGLSQVGGPYGVGTIFTFNTTTNEDSVRYTFSGGTSDGSTPLGSLVPYTLPNGINTITAASVSIYPNPTTGTITVKGLSIGQIVLLYNYLGEKVSSMVAGSSTQLLDIPAQANDVYLVEVLNTDGTLAVEKKIVKTN